MSSCSRVEHRRTVRRTPARANSSIRTQGESYREIGKGLYAWSEAHTVRIDKDDNIWAIDKGSDMVIKFNQAGPRRLGLRTPSGIG